MMLLQKTAGKIMEYFEAFEGSRAAIDTDEILIVRSRSSKKIDIKDMNNKLEGLLKNLDATEVDLFSTEFTDLVTIMDEQIRETENISVESDIEGILNLKKSLEDMRCIVEYKMGLTNKIAIFVIIWKDKSGIGPCFIESVISSIKS